MRLSLRFILPLLLVLTALAYLTTPLVEQLTLRWFIRDLDVRASLIASTVEEAVGATRAGKDADRKLVALFNRISQDERVFAIGYCKTPTATVVASQSYPPELSCDRLKTWPTKAESLLDKPAGPLHVAVRSLGSPDGAQLVVAHDMSFTARRSAETRNYLIYLFIVLGGVVSLMTVAIAHLSWRGWIQGIRALLNGEVLLRPANHRVSPELLPIAQDLKTLVRELENEARMRDEAQMSWTPDFLRTLLKTDLRGSEVMVVSNREPYIHVQKGGKIQVERPASGLVTALEPIMRACSGTWIAHGSGSADRDVVDGRDCVKVPPGQPAYRLRRVWLNVEEEQGYYYGFANEGLWPLCHIAHMRPVFRHTDWEYYRSVNQRFADTVVAEAQRPDPIVLVQDYHFALLPRMIREKLPEATIITFWHIPWPNPESFAICPWSEAILDGLLGSTILGFHTQFHCNNFVDTVDRLLEARVDRESFTVSYGNLLTAVKRYPISIAWPLEEGLVEEPVEQAQARIRAHHGLPPEVLLGVGVDRLDYTKGILERFSAVERLLELEPNWAGRFSFVELAAPTRSSIETYQKYEAEVRAAATRINARHTRNGVPPIILDIAGHGPAEVFAHYRAANLCFVSSLHDGMNLVAKEFVASRDDERGVLILSQFAGASRELVDALIVNPYDENECAAALKLALEMPADEQRDRMRLMRALVREFNVYRWAGRMLLDARAVRERGRAQGGRFRPFHVS
ncbi:MAG: trehalose-6-phosphate synthase [Rhodocyclaceae bacterium]|jgi:trehalose 6-phosphate synthase|nr:trehalose-6-phosphate synthase [Rhodocyclaceae bacterium]